MAAGTLCVLLLVSVVLAFELARRERRALLATKVTSAEVVADLFASALVAPLDFGDADATLAETERVQRSRDVVQVVVWGDRGLLVARGAEAQAPGEPAVADGQSLSDDFLDVTRAIRSPAGKPLGALRVRYSLSRENAAYEQARTRILWLSGAVALVTAAALIWLARRQIVAPLAALVEAARGVERGEVAARAAVQTGDEIGQLAAAFNRMAAAIADRERRLADASRELQQILDCTGQGILLFAADGLVDRVRSREATRLFGPGAAGGDIRALLFPGARPSDVEAQAFFDWVFHAPTISDDDWAEFCQLAPREVSLPDPAGERALSLEFRRVPLAGGPPLTMLVATDITERRALERAVASQQAAHERQLAAARRLAAGGHLLAGFLERARARLQSPGGALDAPAMLQDFHTMKGEARSLGLDDLASALHEAESLLAGQPAPAPAVVRAVEGLAALLDQAERLFIDASPVGRAALDQISVPRGDLDALARLAQAQGGEAALLAARLTSRPFGECALLLLDRAPLWAEAAGKRARVVVEGRDLLVPGPLARALPGVLAHLVRNAIAHGIEAPPLRERSGKPPVGLITLACAQGPAGLLISVEDDGQGIDEAAVRERAAALGMDAGAPLDDLLFAQKLSTARQVDDLAGRGVGLAAARSEVRAVCFNLTLVSGQPSRFVILPIP